MELEEKINRHTAKLSEICDQWHKLHGLPLASDMSILVRPQQYPPISQRRYSFAGFDNKKTGDKAFIADIRNEISNSGLKCVSLRSILKIQRKHMIDWTFTQDLRSDSTAGIIIP